MELMVEQYWEVLLLNSRGEIMQKFKSMLIIGFAILMLSSCQTPQKIDVYNISDEVIDGVVFQDCIVEDGSISFVLSINIDEDINIINLISPSSLEFKNDNVGYGFGDGFGDELILNYDYQIGIDGTTLSNDKTVVLNKHTDYQVTITFDMSETEGLNVDETIDDVSMIVIIDTKTANLKYE